MDTKATRALIEQFNGAWSNNDTEKVAALLAEDVVWILPLGLRPMDRDRVEGRDEVSTGLTVAPGSVPARILDRDSMVRTVHTLIVEGNTAAGFHHMTAEKLVGGATYSNEYVWHYTCVDGKVTRLVEHVDTLHALQQNTDHPLFQDLLGK